MGTILQRLDAEVATFTDSFVNLVKASRVDNSDGKTSQVMIYTYIKARCEKLFFSAKPAEVA